MRLHQYENPDHRIASGRCCDNFLFCVNNCDNLFRFCLRPEGFNIHVLSCPFGSQYAGHVGGDRITFHDRIGRLSNPITFRRTEQWTVRCVCNNVDTLYPLQWCTTFTFSCMLFFLLRARFSCTSRFTTRIFSMMISLIQYLSSLTLTCFQTSPTQNHSNTQEHTGEGVCPLASKSSARKATTEQIAASSAKRLSRAIATRTATQYAERTITLQVVCVAKRQRFPIATHRGI